GEGVMTIVEQRPWLKSYPPEIPPHVEYREIPLYTLLEEAVKKHPDLPALRFFHIKLTYAELWGRVLRCAAAFAELGIKKGDRGALMLPNCPQYVIAYYGALRAGPSWPRSIRSTRRAS